MRKKTKNFMRVNSFLLILIILLNLSCSAIRTKQADKLKNDIPDVEIEFRAAWVATVSNINWPSSPNLTVEDQQKEALAILDTLAKNNFNAVIFQVRPQCDAFYKSQYEPWSYFLTGKQGIAPDPYYNPLEFWISEAHKRGLELHAWINPYRAHHTSGKISSHSIVRTDSNMVVKLKNGLYWLIPTMKEVQEYSTNVIMDIVKNYNVDGIHMDDYFYPYPQYNDMVDFPDSISWHKYLSGGGQLSKGDWRRKAVNDFIQNLYTQIKKEKPYVKVGISPFGIWKPHNPKGITGFNQFEQLFADARLWLIKGWLDYMTPQLYWTIDDYNQSFPLLLGWWKEQNLKKRFVWPGINTGVAKKKEGVREVINEIMISRGFSLDKPGNIFWSVAPLMKFPELGKRLISGAYKNQALIPSCSWINDEKNVSIETNSEIIGDSIKVNLTPQTNSKIIVYKKYQNRWNYKIIPDTATSLKIPLTVQKSIKDSEITIHVDKIGISRVNRNSIQSEIKIIDIE